MYLCFRSVWSGAINFHGLGLGLEISDVCVQNDQFMLSKYAAAEVVFSWLIFKATFWLSFCPSAHLCRPACFCSSSIQLLSPTPPLFPFSHPLCFFSPGTELIWGLRVQRGIEGERIGANWKEGGNMKGRSWREKEEESKQGRGGQEWEKTPQSEVMIWLLLLSSGEGKEECKDMERERKNGREWKRESLLTWPQGGLSSLSFFLPLFITFYTNCPHTKH